MQQWAKEAWETSQPPKNQIPTPTPVLDHPDNRDLYLDDISVLPLQSDNHGLCLQDDFMT